MELTKTRQQLVNETAYKLNIVGTGQTLDAEYGDKIDENIDPLILQLAADQICLVGHTDAIPAEWFDALAGLLANICAPLAGKAFSPDIKEFYEMQLKRLTTNRTSYEILTSEYF